MSQTPAHRLPEPDRPWMMRTYAGHSTARKSNELYRANLAKGQTGLSIAFDLPTQTGYDADHELARGEVGKVGVPIAHRGAMAELMDGIPLETMNTSMTINATAAWLLALYIVTAEEHGVDPRVLQGTTQNDIIKEFLARGTYAFPPAPSMRLIADMVAYTVTEVPRWNPINICSYHLQEAGATPVQEIAYALSNAIAVLDAVRARVDEELMGKVFSRISFFVNAGVRFIEEHAKLRAMGEMWEWIGRNRYGVEDPKQLRFRYGVQVNSLGPDRVPAGEQRPADRARGARRHARPRRPRAGDPAARLERGAGAAATVGSAVVAAHPADPRLRDRPARVPRHLRGLGGDGGARRRARRGRARPRWRSSRSTAAPSRRCSYMKSSLVDSHRERIRRIEAGELIVVGHNKYRETAPSPLAEGEDGGIMTVDPGVEAEAIASLRAVARRARRRPPSRPRSTSCAPPPPTTA